jgi:site-specific DNA-methyltransferase (adenine-specific)
MEEYSKKTVIQLIALCKEHKIKGYSKKSKSDIIALIESHTENKEKTIKPHIKEKNDVKVEIPEEKKAKTKKNEKVEIPKEKEKASIKLQADILHGDCIDIMKTLVSDTAQIIIADPPYNIGKDFGNKSDKQPMDEYLQWCEIWIKECLRVLKPNGTMFIYGFSETLALILSKVPHNINRRWIIWHYTNKNVASLNFWQRSHESIIVLWKNDKVFNKDDIREAYTDGFLNGSAGKERTSTKGRFSNGSKKTTYTAHPNGALPRDVIKIPALAGGSGVNERVDHPTQKPLILCDKLIRSCKQSDKDGYVLVPFAGSGSECLAAKNLNLPFIGIEINEEYIKLINKRLELK